MSPNIELIKNRLNKIIKVNQVDNLDFIVEKTNDYLFGDYATNLAFKLTKYLKKDVMVIAEEIVNELQDDDLFIKVEVKKPGFINFFMNVNILQATIDKINLLKEDYGRGSRKTEYYNLEAVSANPTGPLHIGHARNGAVADSVARILKFYGYKVITEYYINDGGNQIDILAITLFSYYLQILNINVEIPENAYQGEYQKVTANYFVNKYGAKFSDFRVVNGYINNQEVHQLFKTEAIELYLNIIKKQLQEFRVEIDYWSSELEMFKNQEVSNLIEKYINLKQTYEADGALFLKTTNYGDDKDRVLIKKDKSYTYIVADLACHNLRIKRTKCDYLINFWGADHHGYIGRLSAGLQILGYKKDIVMIDLIQMVRLIKDGQEYKMSKRKGTAVWLSDLISEFGVDAVRYMLLSKAGSTHMDFDLNILMEKSHKNPVFYLQYATARCAKLLNKISNKFKFVKKYHLLDALKEREILRELDYFYQVVAIAAKSRQPNIICDYLQALVKLFHSYYTEFPILNEKNIMLSNQRITLIKALYQVLKNGLNLIQVRPRENM